MTLQVGTARKIITPRSHVPLAGLGYYLGRTGLRVRDDLTASAIAFSDSNNGIAGIIALDLMYAGRQLTESIRSAISLDFDLPPSSICVHCSHTHSAPTATPLRGAGELDLEYLAFVAEQARLAFAGAMENRRQVHLNCAHANLDGLTYNRTLSGNPIETKLCVLTAVDEHKETIAALINFHVHPCAFMDLDYFAISRDVPGQVTDRIETEFPSATAIYLQGTCGDINFLPEISAAPFLHEPGQVVAEKAIQLMNQAEPVVADQGVAVVSKRIRLPTRTWTAEEIAVDREEGLYRARTKDTSGWTEGIAKSMVVSPKRLPLRYGGSTEMAVAAISRFALEWTEEMAAKLDGHSRWVETEIQAFRIGNQFLAAHPAELFSSFGLDLRNRFGRPGLFVVGYCNDGVGYIPDQGDIDGRTYAAITSPKNRGEFPYTADAGSHLVETLLKALNELDRHVDVN